MVGSVLGQWLLMLPRMLLLRTDAQRHAGEGLQHTGASGDTPTSPGGSEYITGSRERGGGGSFFFFFFHFIPSAELSVKVNTGR